MTNQVTTTTMNDAGGIVNYASGKITGDGGTPVAVTLATGFVPRYAILLCLSSSVAANVGRGVEWFDGMNDSQALVTTLATGSGSAASKTLSTTLGPVVLGSNPNGAPLNTITWPAGVFDPSATYAWQAEG